MSHVPQRKEKDCLNCGAIVQGRFCHICGQENVVPKETFWHMFTHFFYDITHFDSKFFETTKDLLFRPGFLSKQYMLGKRTRYLHPIRMYVFTSAIFFLFFFSWFKPGEAVSTPVDKPLTAQQRADYIEGLKERIKNDSNNVKLKENLALFEDTTKIVTGANILKSEAGGLKFSFGESDYKNMEEYDSIQKKLPANKRDGWLKKRFIKREIQISEKFKENPNEVVREFAESVLHRLPYMLFISLPLFALILKLVYIRRKQFYYADHGVFTIHLYIFTFIQLLVVFGLSALRDKMGWDFINFIIFLLFVVLLFYLYKAMRNFYGQRRAKTFFKFLFVAFWSLIMMIILFALIAFFSAFTF